MKRWGLTKTSLAAAVAAVLLTGAGCSGGEDDPGTSGLNEPTTTPPPPTTTASTSPSPSPSVDRDAWRSKFTDKQLREFDYALRVWRRFGEVMAPYYREPGDPDEVRQIFEKYTYNATALTDSYIANYVQGGVRVIESTSPLYVTGRKIEVNKKGSLVELDQCTDYRDVDMRRDGKPIPPGPKNDTALLRVQMSYDPGTDTREGGWRVLTTKVVDEPCE